MSEQEIIEGNKLIAEFMGAVTPKTAPEIISSYIKNDEVWYGDNTTPNGQYESAFKIFDLKYHSSWEWLMPVFEKIQYITDYCSDLLDGYYNFDFQIDLLNGVDFKVGKERIYLQTAYSPGQLIDAVWSGIIAFIKWFNEHKSCKNN